MKSTYSLFAIISLSLFVFSACSDDAADDLTLVGNWSGTLDQPDYGSLQTELNIVSLSASTGEGNGSFRSEAEDIEGCDDLQFVCEPLFCNFNLSLIMSSGSNYEFDQLLIGTSTCGDGIFEITYVNDNRINVVWYQEAFTDNRAQGSLTRK